MTCVSNENGSTFSYTTFVSSIIKTMDPHLFNLMRVALGDGIQFVDLRSFVKHGPMLIE